MVSSLVRVLKRDGKMILLGFNTFHCLQPQVFKTLQHSVTTVIIHNCIWYLVILIGYTALNIFVLARVISVAYYQAHYTDCNIQCLPYIMSVI